ncbi:MAG: MmcB family DNA repair protein [Raoultibacter sp.]
MAYNRRKAERQTVVFKSMSRPDKTAYLTEAVQQYWNGKRYSCHVELGLIKHGNLRADVFCLNTKCDMIITEVKSCWADFNTDKKWHKYLPFCMRMYFVVDETLFESRGDEIIARIKKRGCGLIVVNKFGSAFVKSNAKRKTMKNEIVAKMLIKAAWRGGRFA